MTGNELFKDFQRKAGYAYTGSLPTAQANPLFKDALISAIEKKYRELIDQKEYDEIRSVIKTEKVFTPVNNKIYLNSFHYIASVSYTLLGDLTVTVTTQSPHNFTVGETITTLGITGITISPGSVNGTFVITEIVSETSFKYQTPAAVAVGTATPNTGVVSPASGSFISDYWHLLTLKAKFAKDTFYTITDAKNSSPIIITVEERNNIRTGEKMTIAEITGNTNANGTYYVKKLNQYQFKLYSDKDLQIPVSGNGIYVDGGIISRNFYEYCSKRYSDQKTSIFNSPTIEYPQAEITENLFRISPTDEVCSQITIDYVATPTNNLVIDTSDTVKNLELYYPMKFLYFVVDEARIIFAQRYRDTEMYQQAKVEQQANR